MHPWKMLLFALALFQSLASSAQVAVAYVDIDTIISRLPERAGVDTLLERYRVDTLGKRFDSLMRVYSQQDSLLWYRHERLTPTERDRFQQEWEQLTTQLQHWHTFAIAAIDGRKEELLALVVRRIKGAVAAIAKRNEYTHAFSRAAVVAGPAAVDLTGNVLRELGFD